MKRWKAVSLVFVISEIVASLGVWHGTPTDWRGLPLRFWHYEFWRLAYWIPLAGAACAILWAIWYFLLGRGRNSILLPLTLASSLLIEWVTSVIYWRALNIEQASFLGWASEFYYIGDHLVCWAMSLLISACVWLFWAHRKSSERAVRVHRLGRSG
jgi:hypothetical protein